jgi:hypothetical protein
LPMEPWVRRRAEEVELDSRLKLSLDCVGTLDSAHALIANAIRKQTALRKLDLILLLVTISLLFVPHKG